MRNDTLEHQVRSALGAMMADAPTPDPFDELSVVSVTAEPVDRRPWVPVVAGAVGFAAVLLVVGVIAVRGVPSTAPAAGLGTIYATATDLPDDLVLRASEVSSDGLGTTQIYVEADADGFSEANRSVSITVSDHLARQAELGVSPELIESLPDDFYDSDQVFDAVVSAAERTYGPAFAYERVVVRGRPALLAERIEAAGSGMAVLSTDVVVSEGGGILTEINGQNLSTAEVMAIARSLMAVAEAEFPEVPGPGRVIR